ncbi:hypothetical protein ABZ471_01375 [Streptomyces sp. NPDC005728]|uniref:hypothetical protein n=1 Tax=Streptomyces sp. NPDC005728 TaxID=3157054 RepID=UPI0033F9D202
MSDASTSVEEPQAAGLWPRRPAETDIDAIYDGFGRIHVARPGDRLTSFTPA